MALCDYLPSGEKVITPVTTTPRAESVVSASVLSMTSNTQNDIDEDEDLIWDDDITYTNRESEDLIWDDDIT